jgi:hypothetical protein
MTVRRNESHTAQQGDGVMARRRYLTVDGVIWEVRLFVSQYDRRSRPDLVFESDGVVRRVRDYPEDWHTLSDEMLFAISSRR